MKKLLITTLLFTGLIAFVPNASADHKRDRDRDCDHDRYEHREYRPAYRESYQPSYRYYEERPVYYRPAPVVRYRSYDDGGCRSEHRTYRRPGLSFLFGF